MGMIENFPLEIITEPLLSWFRKNARVLPWREDATPYRVWVSEIMLQQTRVEAVKPYFQRFTEALPTIRDLAECEEERLLKLWEGLGYYNRVRNMQAAARMVMEEYQGQLPADYEELLKLKGIGHYTAGAIASIAYKIPVPAVDGNVLRVYARLCGDGGDISTPQMKKRVAQAVAQVIPVGAPGAFNQALMELGATVCLPNGAPLCERCPGRSLCAALAHGRTGELPVKAPKKPRRVEERTVWLIFWENRAALRRRPGRGLLAGLWEFPSEPGDGPLPPQWGVEALSQQYAGQARHIFTHIEWHMTLRTVEAGSDALPEGWVWAGRAQLEEKYALPSAFEGALRAVNERLNGGT